MDFSLNSEQKLLRYSIREFAEKELSPLANELDDGEHYDVGLLRQMSDLGVFGIFVPENLGGGGMDHLSYCIAVEEISRIDVSHGATVAAANSFGIFPIYKYGHEDQKDEWLPQLCSGEKFAFFLLSRPSDEKKIMALNLYAYKKKAIVGP